MTRALMAGWRTDHSTRPHAINVLRVLHQVAFAVVKIRAAMLEEGCLPRRWLPRAHPTRPAARPFARWCVKAYPSELR